METSKPWVGSQFLIFFPRASSLLQLNSQEKMKRKRRREIFRMHERVKKKVKWSGLQWFLLFVLFFFSHPSFNGCHLIVELLFIRERGFIVQFLSLDFIALWWRRWWWFDKNEIKYCTLYGVMLNDDVNGRSAGSIDAQRKKAYTWNSCAARDSGHGVFRGTSSSKTLLSSKTIFHWHN